MNQNESLNLVQEVAEAAAITPPPQQGMAPRKKKSLASIARNQKIFCGIMVALPLLQFVLFYICVNFNSILLAFQRTDMDGKVQWGFMNFAQIFREFKTEAVFGYAFKNSMLAFLTGTIIQIPLTLLFSYYIFKKAIFGKFFKIMLFIPSIVTSIVLVLLYMYFVDMALPAFLEAIFKKDFPAFYGDLDTRFGTILMYSIIMGFGGNTLMFLSSMNSINESVLEAARLDGATFFQEFFYVVLPMVYPTMVTFLIIGISGIFTNQLNLVSFMGTDNPTLRVETFGYYMFQQTFLGAVNYPKMSALGLMITVVVVPTTLLVKWALEKFGPSAA